MRTQRPGAAGTHGLFVLALAAVSAAGGAAIAAKPVRAPSVPVDSTLARDLGGGCAYTAHVQGTIAIEPTFYRGEPHRYLPDVTVTARLACGGVERASARDRIVAPFVSREAFLQVLSRAATVTTGEGEALCFYRAEFDFNDVAMQPQDLHRWCEPSARGGGPRVPTAALPAPHAEEVVE